jgi:hypothetical protein
MIGVRMIINCFRCDKLIDLHACDNLLLVMPYLLVLYLF